MASANASEKPYTRDILDQIFPPERADEFFEALLGDPAEGAYDISLRFIDVSNSRLTFEFQLRQRPGKCLACNLTHGLPEVFTRHRVIDMKDVIHQIDLRMPNGNRCGQWRLGRTREISRELHVIPLTIDLIPG